MLMETVKVNLGERSYPIFIGKGTLRDLGKTLKKYTNSERVALVTNPTVAALYLGEAKKSLIESGFDVNVIEVPDGEEFKSLKWAGKIFDKLISFKMDRYSPLIALGGGVVGDITGFVAATYLRGVPYVQVPTTLLAQVDSSVGGKTAVNHRKGKNLIGAFYQPKFVYIDVDTLKTLDRRELRSGFAEVIKYGVIKDRDFFEYLEENIEKALDLDYETLVHIIRRSCQIKAEVVESDERETGYRAILNFGHTFGHAVETLTKYKKYKHGEAVAIGMVAAANISEKLKLCSSNARERVDELIRRYNLPTELTGLSKERLLKSITLDKKATGNEVKFIGLEGIGNVKMYQIKIDELISYI